MPRAPPSGATGVRNVLADAPCNSSYANAEVVEAWDPVASVLYELWIGCGGIGFSRSVDGGYSFEAAFAVPGSTTGASWDPALAVAPNGTVYAAFMLNNGTGDSPAVAWSYDHGQSFAGWTEIYPATTGEFSDRDYIAVAPNGTVFVSWDLSPNSTLDQIGCAPGGSCYFLAGDYNIVVEWSSDGGRRWSAPVPVEPEYPNAAAPAGPLLVEPNGTVDLLYEDYPTTGSPHWLGVGRNYFVRSVDGGVHWSVPVAVENGTFANDTWWIDGDLARDSSGTLYATFDSQNATADTAFVAVSRDDGGSWSAPIRLNPDHNSAVHALVSVAGGANGTAYLSWLANNSTLGWSVFAATLFNNGSLLSAPTLVSSQFGIPGEWIGDTMGIADLGNGRVAVSWSYGVPVGNASSSQVFAAVLGAAPPVDAPRITSVVPGRGNVTLSWAPPTGAGDWVGGYLLVWGLENQHNFYNLTLPASATSTTVPNLPPFLHWYFEIAATNGAGEGPLSAPVYVDLTDWGVVRGTVTPASATVRVDGLTVPSPGGAYTANTTAGPHVVDFSLSGYFELFVTVLLPWNDTAWQNATLVPIPGSVEGWVHPVDATVQFDGASVALTTGGYFLVGNLSSGTHVLTVTRHAFNSLTENLTVADNTTVWANVSLVPSNGTIAITVTPVTATVTLNGNAVSLNATGEASLSLFPGRYALEVAATGFLPYFANATLASLAVVPLTVTLLPAPTNSSGNPDGGQMLLLPGYLLVVFAVVLVVGVAASALLLRRRRGPGSAAGERAPTYGDPLWESDEAPEPAEPVPDDAA